MNGRHKWGPPARIAAEEGCDYTERKCSLCGILRLTIHPPGNAMPWVEWVIDGEHRRQFDRTPTCTGTP